MGVEGRDKVKALEAGAVALSGQLGKTVQRLRKAYNLSLSELSEQSGVAKSIISQIERNETNPTLATIWRLSQALDVSIERVLATGDEEPFIEKSSRADTPILVSEDGKVRLAAIEGLGLGGRLVVYGTSSEEVAEVNIRTLYRKGLSVFGYTNIVEPVERQQEVLRRLFDSLLDGSLRVPHEVIPLERAASAHRRLLDRSVSGKLVIDCRAR